MNIKYYIDHIQICNYPDINHWGNIKLIKYDATPHHCNFCGNYYKMELHLVTKEKLLQIFF